MTVESDQRLAAQRIAPLLAFAGIGQRLLVGALAERHALQADAEASFVHHHEHVFEAAIRLAEQVADRSAAECALVAIGHDTGRTTVDAQLVFERNAVSIVARPQRTIAIDQEFRHQEQRDALDAGRRVRQASKHQMHDVVCQIMIAVADENFLAEDAVTAIRLRLCPGADQGKIGTGLRLGQIHRPGPFAADHLVQINRFQFVAGAEKQRFDCAHGQQGADRKSQVRRAAHFLDCRTQDLRQPLATKLGRRGQANPAAGTEGAISLLPARRRAHTRRGQLAAFDIANTIERCQHLGAQPGRLVEHRIHQVGRRFFVTGQLRNLVQPDDLVEHEAHVLHRSLIMAHSFFLTAARRHRPRPSRCRCTC